MKIKRQTDLISQPTYKKIRIPLVYGHVHLFIFNGEARGFLGNDHLASEETAINSLIQQIFIKPGSVADARDTAENNTISKELPFCEGRRTANAGGKQTEEVINFGQEVVSRSGSRDDLSEE